MLNSCVVDGMKCPLAVGNARAARHQHLYDAGSIAEPVDLSRCQLGIVGRNRERVAKACVHRQPLFNKDVIDRRGLHGRVVGLQRQPDAQNVLGVENAILDLVDIEEVPRELDSAALDALPIPSDGIGAVNTVRVPVVQIAWTPVATLVAPALGLREALRHPGRIRRGVDIRVND